MAPKEALPPNLVELSDRQAMGVVGAEINTAASMLALSLRERLRLRDGCGSPGPTDLGFSDGERGVQGR